MEVAGRGMWGFCRLVLLFVLFSVWYVAWFICHFLLCFEVLDSLFPRMGHWWWKKIAFVLSLWLQGQKSFEWWLTALNHKQDILEFCWSAWSSTLKNILAWKNRRAAMIIKSFLSPFTCWQCAQFFWSSASTSIFHSCPSSPPLYHGSPQNSQLLLASIPLLLCSWLLPDLPTRTFSSGAGLLLKMTVTKSFSKS